VGQRVSETLMGKFDQQIVGLEKEVDRFEKDLKQWEVGMQKGLTDNYQHIHQFNAEIN
jgi:hypothetical protein